MGPELTNAVWKYFAVTFGSPNASPLNFSPLNGLPLFVVNRYAQPLFPTSAE
jgi:hypothetical protein